MKHRVEVLGLIAVLSVGCVGKDRILFVTKTSLGIDIDTQPPTLDISYSRKEGTVSPEFNGKVLPQEASFGNEVGFINLFPNTALGQSFATGNAALLLTKYLGTPAKPHVENLIEENEILNEEPSRVAGTLADARPYFFGTDTGLGIRVTFDPETGYLPNSFQLGYKRKEAACVPVSEHEPAAQGEEPSVGLPSLLATTFLDAGTQGGYKSRFVQFFATGVAASYIAARPESRQTIGMRVIADPEIRAKIESKNQELITRGAQFVEAERVTRVAALTATVEKITDDAAVQLNNTPPTSVALVEEQLSKASESQKNDPATARRMIGMRLSLMDRTDETLQAWEAALAAAPKK